jgi:hypothetical protein
MCSGSIFASDRQQNLAYCNPSTNTLWLAKRSPHAGLQAISSSTRQHFVDPQHMERVHSDTQVKRILASILGHVLVASNPSCFQSFTRNVLFLPADQMYAEGELVHPLLLHTHIVDANLRVWHSSTEPRLWVWLVLDLPITSRRPCEKFTVRQQEERILLNTKISLKKNTTTPTRICPPRQEKITRKSREKIKGEEGGCSNTKPITTKQQKQQQLRKQKIKIKNKNKNIKGRRENLKKGQEKRREEKRKGKERTYGDP